MAAVAALTVVGMLPAGASGGDVLVSNGSPTSPFSQNKQNEPTVAVDQNNPNVVVAGANDNIDMEACNAGADNTCPFTPGIGSSGVYFSFDSGQSWTQPTYTGWSARNCLGSVGPDAGCQPQTAGPIGTLPWYYENGLESDGDPAVAFGPRPGPNGFSWSNGSRLYYANLTSNFPGATDLETFKGAEAIAVSRTDNVQAAAASDKSAWMPPVVLSRQSRTTFSDKEQIWADNASSSPFFGNTYVCWVAFRSNSHGNSFPSPLMVASSRDGGGTWGLKQVTSAATFLSGDGCTIRTDSTGRTYVFFMKNNSNTKQLGEYMVTSRDGGQTWSPPREVVANVSHPGTFDANVGRPVQDGVAGARNDLATAPSIDVANGAPTGADASNRIVLTWVAGTTADSEVMFTESADGGRTWATPRSVSPSSDFGYYSAAAISPDGSNVWVTYNAFTTPYQQTTSTPRSLVGVVLNAKAPSGPGPTGAFAEVHRSQPGDPRGSSQNNLVGEFLGDYVYASATRDYGVAVWNDTRNAGVCGAMNAYRQALADGQPATAPDVQQVCPANFGNSDIFGAAIANP